MLTGRSAVYVRVMFGYATDVAKSGSSPDQTWSARTVPRVESTRPHPQRLLPPTALQVQVQLAKLHGPSSKPRAPFSSVLQLKRRCTPHGPCTSSTILTTASSQRNAVPDKYK